MHLNTQALYCYTNFMEYLRYLGLFNLIFVFLLLKILTAKDKSFSLKKHTFSCLGNNPVYGKYFNFGLCLFSIFQTCFAIYISTHITYYSIISTTLFITGGLILCFAGIITNGKYPVLHDVLVEISVSLVVLGMILLIYNVTIVNRLIGIILIFATFLIPYSAYLRRRTGGGDIGS